jgi:peptidoglycan-N-acetylglucosamine deacetylase
METRRKSSRAGWLLALAIIAAPLLLVAGSWSEITSGSGTGQTAVASQGQGQGDNVTGPGSRPLRDPRGYVALTYDDGPSPELTPKLLDTLAAYDVKATFFVQGNHTHDNPELVQRELDEGHVVGNHSYDHPDLTAADSEQVRRELLGTNEELGKIGYTPTLYRPPFDRHDPRVDAIAGSLGLTRVSWTYRHDPQDWDTPEGLGKPADVVCKSVVSQAAPGDVILMHDRFQGSVDAAPCIIRGLRGEGLEPGIVQVAGKYSPKNGDSYIKVVAP